MKLDSKNERAVKRPKMKKSMIITIGVIVVLIAVMSAGYYYIKSKGSAKNAVAQQTVKVEKGELLVSVDGSGSLTASDKFDISPGVNGTVTKVYFKDGDKVKAGDLILEMDDFDALSEVQKIQNNIEQTELTLNDNNKDLRESNIGAPISGEIADVQVKEGDQLGSNAAILTIIDKSRLKLTIGFKNKYRENLKKGQQVKINAFDTAKEEYYNVAGTINSISAPTYSTQEGEKAYNLEIIVPNNGHLIEGMVAIASMDVSGQTLKSNGNGTLKYYDTFTVKSKTSGIVEKVKVSAGQTVGKGEILVQLDYDDLTLSAKTTGLKLKDYYNQLEAANKRLAYYKIYAPIDGTFVMPEAINIGDNLKQGDVVASISNYSKMEFVIDVDELDIAKISVGQTAKVSLDALPKTEKEPLSGVVSNIAVEGTSTNGITTYPVTILVDQAGSLKGGMNANAEILVDKKQDALYLPIEAVQTRNGKSFVMVKDKSENGEIKSKRQPVTTGINNKEYIEIAKGLKEGDEVIILASSSSTTTRTNNGPMGGMPMPMGGGPSGGGNSSGTRK